MRWTALLAASVCLLGLVGCGGEAAVCGDGVCDDGESTQTCPADCTSAQCGDSVCEGEENSQSCGVDCYCGNGSCDPTESYYTCENDCPFGRCGNLVCEPGESTWSCLGDCPSTCDNGVLENGESCDGTDLGVEACSTVSSYEQGVLACTTGCVFDTSGCYTCGNGSREPVEACDGADLGNETCETLGFHGGTLACTASCTLEDTGCTNCGNGVCDADMGENYASCPGDCGFVSVFAGGEQTCAIRSDGTAWCWGNGDRCQVGDGDCVDRAAPRQVIGITNAVEMAVGSAYHNCARLADGTGRCWGENGLGQLGDGSVTDSATPVPVANLNDIVAIEASMFVTCAVRADGTTWCWGRGNETLGLGNTPAPEICQPPGWTTPQACALLPMQTVVGSDGAALSMESSSACLLENAGTVKCWGLIFINGTTHWEAFPDQVDGTALGIHFDSAPYHGCIIEVGGALRCWGSNEGGQLGDGTIGVGSDAYGPPVAGLPPIVDVAPGGRARPWSHTCALDDTGHVWCWGYNYRGQLGDGTTTLNPVPGQVPGLSNVVQIASGGDHTCALVDTGEIWCWGWNEDGQLGNGSFASTVSSPVQVVMP